MRGDTRKSSIKDRVEVFDCNNDYNYLADGLQCLGPLFARLVKVDAVFNGRLVDDFRCFLKVALSNQPPG